MRPTNPLLRSERQKVEEHFHFGASVDCIVFGYDGHELNVLLIERGKEPFKGQLGIPGDLVHVGEGLTEATDRVLRDLTGIENVYMEELGAFGSVNRHPLGRVITIAYYALINMPDRNPNPSSWATDAKWVNLKDAKDLAFDHDDIIAKSMDALRSRVRNRPIGANLLPEEFTLGQYQSVFESILGVALDKANFRKKILATRLLKPLDKHQEAVNHRPARLYAFDQKAYNQLLEQGMDFQL